MSFLAKSKEFLKPFFMVLAFFILCLVISPKDDQTASLLPLSLPEFEYSQKIFADPSKKAKPESLDFVLVEDNSLQAASPAITVTPQVLGALMEGYDPEDVKKIIVEYMVEPGDNLWAIASHFGVSLDTILWANDLNKNAYLQQGQRLIIPPVSGVIHHVKTGDTVSAIAQKYEAETEEIIAFNGLSGEADIFIGDILIVPGGEISAPVVNYAPAKVPLTKSYFICPIDLPCRITQGLHWYNAIDFSHGRCGDYVYSAAAGVVQKVKLTNSTSRWAFGGAGNHLTILHSNGVVTMYGHIATSLVNPGDSVYQGQPIALMGGQPGTAGAGMSTGCHLHFGVTGARNPFTY